MQYVILVLVALLRLIPHRYFGIRVDWNPGTKLLRIGWL